MKEGQSILKIASRPVPITDSKISSEINLQTNFFQITLNIKREIYLYDVKFSPEISSEDNIREKKGLINKLANLKELDLLTPLIYNGTNLFSTKKMKDTLIKKVSDKIGSYNISISLSSVIDSTKISKSRNDKKGSEAAQYILNIILKKMLNAANYHPVGRTRKYLKLSQKLNAHNDRSPYFVSPGYKTSINLLESGLLITIDYTPRIINKTSVYDIIKEIRFDHNLSPNEKQQRVKEILENRSVLASYGSFRLYKVDEIDFNSSPKSEIIQHYNKSEEKNEQISLEEYYYQAYKIKLQYPNDAPLLVNKSYIRNRKTGEKIEDPTKLRKLIPELCNITGLEENMKSNRNQGFQLIEEYTKLSPNQRIMKVKELIEEFRKENCEPNHVSAKQIAMQWGMEIDSLPLEISGRTLLNQKIKLGNEIIETATPNGLLRFQSAIAQPREIKDWILCGTNATLANSKDFIKCLLQAASSFGMRLEMPIQAFSHSNYADQLITAAKSCLDERRDTKVQFIVFIIRNRDVYKAIKMEFTSKETPYLTQVILESTINKDFKKIRAVCSKIALQMNAKLNSPLWTLVLPPEFPKHTMFVGMDLSHGSDKNILSVSSSFDPQFSRFFTQAIEIEKKTEDISREFAGLVFESLRYFYSKTGKTFKPDLIIIYRDGVSESKKIEMLHVEVEAILKCFKAIHVNYNPNFIFCTVNQTSGVRYFSIEPKGSSNYRGGMRGGEQYSAFVNPPAGTYVYEHITNPDNYEFFLIPQYVSQGCANPVKFHVLFNNTNIPYEWFISITNGMCYNYFNWQGAIKTPGPCKYAKKKAEQITRVTQTIPDATLNETMHFL